MAATGNEVVLLKQLKSYDDIKIQPRINSKIDKPTVDGTNGQVLVYGSSGNLWVTVPEFITETEADEAYSAKSHTHDAATTDVAGFMSAADKTKLDGLSNYVLPEATSTTLGGVKTATDEDAKAFLGY